MEDTPMKKLLLLFFFIFTTTSFAEQCKIGMVDLTEALQSDGNKVITAFNLTDTHSNEPIRRYVQLVSDGSIVIVEQKHCLIHNLTITILLPEGLPIDNVPLQLSNTLNKTVIWKKWFKTLDAVEILRSEISSTRFTSDIGKPGSFSYSLDDKIRAKSENSETLLRLVNLESGTLPFEKIISLYIGVGGL
jgi:hypothetical protein